MCEKGDAQKCEKGNAQKDGDLKTRQFCPLFRCRLNTKLLLGIWIPDTQMSVIQMVPLFECPVFGSPLKLFQNYFFCQRTLKLNFQELLTFWRQTKVPWASLAMGRANLTKFVTSLGYI